MSKVGDGFQITQINLKCEADVPDIKKDEFMKHAEEAKVNCPVSQALKAVEIRLEANLTS